MNWIAPSGKDKATAALEEGLWDPVAECEIRSASIGVKTSRSFDIRHSSFDISPGPACGSGGMFVQAEAFVESHCRTLGDIGIYGQDKWVRRPRHFGLATRAGRVMLRGQQPKQSNATARRLAVMRLALCGIEADFGPEHADRATGASTNASSARSNGSPPLGTLKA